MIRFEKLTKIYATGVQALDGVCLHVPQGEILGVVGPSGAGKSTLLRCANLLERPTAGSVQINGLELTTLSPAGLRQARRRIGMIFQHFNLLTSRTAAGNIGFPLEVMGMEKADRDRRVEQMLELVGLSDKRDAYPAQLSGGQQQRVGIARALATQPDVLLCDEATSALDPQTTASILSLLKDLNHRLGLTILLITHEMEVVRQVCDRVAVLEAGKIVEEGRLVELVSRPGSRLAQAFFPAGEALPYLGAAARATITFRGESAGRPILAGVARRFDVDVNILGGSIQTFGGERVGRLQVALNGEQTAQALSYLRGLGLQVEV